MLSLRQTVRSIRPEAPPWSRLFARLFDLWWETMIAAFVVGVVLAFLFKGAPGWLDTRWGGLILTLLCLPLALVLDAVVYDLSGTTPGKKLLGVTVTTSDEQSLTFAQYIRRNFSLWLTGLGVGIPLLNLVTMGNQLRRLGNGESATYDESPGYRVWATPLSKRQIAACVVAFLALFAIRGVVSRFERTVSPTHEIVTTEVGTVNELATRTPTSGVHVWNNPITGLDAEIPIDWEYMRAPSKPGKMAHVFKHRVERVAIFLTLAQMDGQSLRDYIRDSLDHSLPGITYEGSGKFGFQAGYPAWNGVGRMKSRRRPERGQNQGPQIETQIIQIDATRFVLTTMHMVPGAEEAAQAKRLQEELLATVR